MSKFVFALLLFASISFAFEESDLQALIEYRDQRKENIQNVMAKIDQEFDLLRKNNPKYNYQDAFESDEQYLARMQSVVGELREAKIQIENKYKLEELRDELWNFYNKEYYNSDFTIVWDKEKYNPNTEEWEIYIKHNIYNSYHYEFWNSLKIPRDFAKAIYEDQARIVVKGNFNIGYDENPQIVNITIIDKKSSYNKRIWKNAFILKAIKDREYIATHLYNFYAPVTDQLNLFFKYQSSLNDNYSGVGYIDLKTGICFHNVMKSIEGSNIIANTSGQYIAGFTSNYSRGEVNSSSQESDFRIEVRDIKTNTIVFYQKLDEYSGELYFDPNNNLYYYTRGLYSSSWQYTFINNTFRAKKWDIPYNRSRSLFSPNLKTYCNNNYVYDLKSNQVISPQLDYIVCYSQDSKFIILNNAGKVGIFDTNKRKISFYNNDDKIYDLYGIDSNNIIWCSDRLLVADLEFAQFREINVDLVNIEYSNFSILGKGFFKDDLDELYKTIAPYDSLIATLPKKLDEAEISKNGASILNENNVIGDINAIIQVAGQDTSVVYSTVNTLLDFKLSEPFLYVVEQNDSLTFVKKINLENQSQEDFPLTTDYVSSFVYGNGASLIVQGDLTNQISGEINKSVLGKIISALPTDHKMVVFNKTYKILINEIETELFIDKTNSSGTIAREALVDFVRSHDIDLHFSNEGKLTALLTSRDANTSQLYIWDNIATPGELLFETDQLISHYALKGDSLLFSCKNGENYYLNIHNIQSKETLFSEYFGFDPNISYIEFNPQNKSFLSTFKNSSGVEYFKVYRSKYDFDLFNNKDKHCYASTWSQDGNSCYFILGEK